MSLEQLEPIRPKREFPQHFPLSVRTFERCIKAGMPHYRTFGKVGFRSSEVEGWLIQHDYLERRGEA